MEGQVEEGSPSRAEGRKASGLGTEDHTLTEPDLPQPTHGLWHINSLDPHTASRSGHSLEAGEHRQVTGPAQRCAGNGKASMRPGDLAARFLPHTWFLGCAQQR